MHQGIEHPGHVHTEAEKQQAILFAQMFPNGITANNESPNYSGTDKSKTVLKINKASARTLLEKARMDNQYLPAITEEDINEFIKKWDAAYAAQALTTSASGSHTETAAGASTSDSSTVVKSISALDPITFASDFIWTKVDFGKEGTLGGKALGFIQQIRDFLGDNNITGFSDVEIQTAARGLTMGKSTFADFSAKMQERIILNNPQFAQRLKDNPGSTIRSLAQPYLKMMADELELDEKGILLSDALLDKALRPDGTAGKLPMMSLPDFKRALLADPRYQATIKANESARQMATGMSSALGFGI